MQPSHACILFHSKKQDMLSEPVYTLTVTVTDQALIGQPAHRVAAYRISQGGFALTGTNKSPDSKPGRECKPGP